jgi:hypothetical protein
LPARGFESHPLRFARPASSRGELAFDLSIAMLSDDSDDSDDSESIDRHAALQLRGLRLTNPSGTAIR